jgi:NADH-quinone oxidoreductase subunit M
MNLSEFVTFSQLLIYVPLMAGLFVFFTDKESNAKLISLFASIVVLIISFLSIIYAENKALVYGEYQWMKYIGNSFSLGQDGMGRMLTLLTAIAFPLIFISIQNKSYKNANVFYGLMLLTQAGLMGVFTAYDALLFYFFWELALIPIYFLSSRWGGEKRIQATFKFFVYTFAGSLLMLVGIIYVYMHTTGTQLSGHSFGLNAFYAAGAPDSVTHKTILSTTEQNWLFWLFFTAFAIKMPIFPFHTWQPDAYEQSPTPVTMILSGIMVKMGLFACIRWLIPIFPDAVEHFKTVVIVLAVIGMIYASCIAIMQDNLKRLVAYSSIAHIGLMCAAIFADNKIGMQGVMLQMFNHGINIIGLWIVIELLEQQLGIKKISELGGIAHKAPFLTIMLVIIALANIALPLTNAFVGEFMMFAGLYHFNGWITAAAGLSIILAAVYTLNMIKKVFLGDTNSITGLVKEVSLNQKIILVVVVVLIFMAGIYPQPMIDLTKQTVTTIVTRFK